MVTIICYTQHQELCCAWPCVHIMPLLWQLGWTLEVKVGRNEFQNHKRMNDQNYKQSPSTRRRLLSSYILIESHWRWFHVCSFENSYQWNPTLNFYVIELDSSIHICTSTKIYSSQVEVVFHKLNKSIKNQGRKKQPLKTHLVLLMLTIYKFVSLSKSLWPSTNVNCTW